MSNKRQKIKHEPQDAEVSDHEAAFPDYDRIRTEAWLVYDKKLTSPEAAIELLMHRMKGMDPHEIRMLLKANKQLQTGSAGKRRCIAEGIVLGFSHPCSKCGLGVKPVFAANGTVEGYACGGAFERTAHCVVACTGVRKSRGGCSFKSPYDYVNKYLDVTGHFPHIRSDSPDQDISAAGRAGQLFRLRHKGKEWKKPKGYAPVPPNPYK